VQKRMDQSKFDVNLSTWVQSAIFGISSLLEGSGANIFSRKEAIYMVCCGNLQQTHGESILLLKPQVSVTQGYQWWAWLAGR